MESTLYLFLCAVILLSLFVCKTWLYPKLRRALAFHVARRRYNATRAPRYPHHDWWGYDLYKEREEATKRGRMMKLWDMQFEQLGHTWEEQFFGKRRINTRDRANIQQICALGSEDYGKGDRPAANRFLGHGILASEGPKWRFSRALIKPTFSRAETGDIGRLKIHVDRLFALIPRDGSTFDMQPLLKKLFLDTSTDFLFGDSTDCLLPDSPFTTDEFLQNFETALAGVGKRRSAGPMAFRFYFDKSFPEAIAKVHAYIDVHVARALELTAKEDGSSPLEGKSADDVPSSGRYILLYEMAKQIRDPIELRAQILNVFMASRDTTGILVSNVLFQLARNPRIWAQLRDTALALGERPDYTFEMLKPLLPFRHVIFETLRTVGPSGGSTRMANKDTILPHGGGPDGQTPVFVAQGDTVFAFFWGLHHNKEVFGEDSYEFKPERWRDLRAPQWDFVPFAGGPRTCPAQNQVMVHVTYLLVRLTRKYEQIENRDPVQEYVELARMLTESRNGVMIGLLPAITESEKA